MANLRKRRERCACSLRVLASLPQSWRTSASLFGKPVLPSFIIPSPFPPLRFTGLFNPLQWVRGKVLCHDGFPLDCRNRVLRHGKQGKTMVMSSPVLRVHSSSFALLCFASLNTFSSFFLSFQYKMLVPYSFVYRKIRHRLYNPIRNLFSSCVDNNKLSQAPRHPLSSFVQRTF